MHIQGGQSFLKGKVPEKTVQNIAKAETTFSNSIDVEATIDSKTKKIFSLQKTDDNRYFLSSVTDYKCKSDEFVKDESIQVLQFIPGDNACKAVLNYCIENSFEPLKVKKIDQEPSINFDLDEIDGEDRSMGNNGESWL